MINRGLVVSLHTNTNIYCFQFTLWKTSFNSPFIHQFVFNMCPHMLYHSVFLSALMLARLNEDTNDLLLSQLFCLFFFLICCFFLLFTFQMIDLDALSHYLLVWGWDWMYRTVLRAGPSALWWGGIFTQVCSASVTKVSTRTHRAASYTLTWTSLCGSATVGQTRNKQYNRETSSMSL